MDFFEVLRLSYTLEPQTLNYSKTLKKRIFQFGFVFYFLKHCKKDGIVENRKNRLQVSLLQPLPVRFTRRPNFILSISVAKIAQHRPVVPKSTNPFFLKPSFLQCFKK